MARTEDTETGLTYCGAEVVAFGLVMFVCQAEPDHGESPHHAEALSTDGRVVTAYWQDQ